MAQTPAEFGASFKKFMDQVVAHAPVEEPYFVRRIAEHLGQRPTGLPVVSEAFQSFDHPNIQLALDELIASDGYASDAIGVAAPHRGYMPVKLADLLAEGSRSHFGALGEGPLEYKNINLDDRVLPCLQHGLLLLTSPSHKLVCFVTNAGHVDRGKILLEVMAADRQVAEQFLAEIRKAMRCRNAYRGRIISLSLDTMGELHVHFHLLQPTPRDSIILPPNLLELVERQTIRFSQHAQKLAAAGRHLKRGVLLHGPPGTGKTLTAMYLAQQMEGRTVLLVTGRTQGLIEQVCWMARALEPSTVILEDVDLIARDRDQADGCTSALLFELLNQMDGLASDFDILFLLTTNRPDLLEPALASRPGRIDMAIEIPVPDADCRRRLFELYGAGLDIPEAAKTYAVDRTAGASAAFIRELLRRAAVIAADDGDRLRVSASHLKEALRELILTGGPLTRNLLGFAAEPEEDWSYED